MMAPFPCVAKSCMSASSTPDTSRACAGQGGVARAHVGRAHRAGAGGARGRLAVVAAVQQEQLRHAPRRHALPDALRADGCRVSGIISYTA